MGRRVSGLESKSSVVISSCMSTYRKNGQFMPTPSGVKTALMLAVEKKLGCSLEEDFRLFYTEKGWGQKRLATRWGVKRATIFTTARRGNRRCWAEMLGLNVRRTADDQPRAQRQDEMACEVCGVAGLRLDGAHWVAAAAGGSAASYNILKLCPNCHRKLDRDDIEAVGACREVLLFREAKKLIETGKDTPAKRRRLVELMRAILNRQAV
jgi:hypothetical protein